MTDTGRAHKRMHASLEPCLPGKDVPPLCVPGAAWPPRACFFVPHSRSPPLPLLRRRYPDLWEYYKQGVASFWTVEEVDFTGDLIDWHRLKSE